MNCNVFWLQAIIAEEKSTTNEATAPKCVKKRPSSTPSKLKSSVKGKKPRTTEDPKQTKLGGFVQSKH